MIYSKLIVPEFILIFPKKEKKTTTQKSSSNMLTWTLNTDWTFYQNRGIAFQILGEITDFSTKILKQKQFS